MVNSNGLAFSISKETSVLAGDITPALFIRMSILSHELDTSLTKALIESAEARSNPLTSTSPPFEFPFFFSFSFSSFAN